MKKLVLILIPALFLFSYNIIACGGDTDPKENTTQDGSVNDTMPTDKPVTSDDMPTDKPVTPDNTPTDKPVTPDNTPGDKPVTPDNTPGDKPVTPDDTPGDKVAPTGACTNAADKALLADAAKVAEVRKKASSCGLKCLGDADKSKCATDCVKKDTGLSSGCSACYVGTIMCSIQHCLGQCATNPTSAACVKCQNDNKCTENFYKCSGLSPAP